MARGLGGDVRVAEGCLTPLRLCNPMCNPPPSPRPRAPLRCSPLHPGAYVQTALHLAAGRSGGGLVPRQHVPESAPTRHFIHPPQTNDPGGFSPLAPLCYTTVVYCLKPVLGGEIMLCNYLHGCPCSFLYDLQHTSGPSVSRLHPKLLTFPTLDCSEHSHVSLAYTP
jgi:hypothetical protein